MRRLCEANERLQSVVEEQSERLRRIVLPTEDGAPSPAPGSVPPTPLSKLGSNRPLAVVSNLSPVTDLHKELLRGGPIDDWNSRSMST